MPSRAVDFAVPVEIAFDYLVDPRNRPEWQSSLRAVELESGRVAVGQRWVDLTSVGLRPRMETTALTRPATWTERGTWRGVEAVLTLEFTATGGGCRVAPDFGVRAGGVLRPLGPLLATAARSAVPRDLRRASRILSERSSGD